MKLESPLLAIVVTLLAVALLLPIPSSADGGSLAIEMSCFPAPGAPLVPPCLVPDGLPADLLDGTSGLLEIRVDDDGSTNLEFKAEGLDPSWVITAWISYFYPPGPAPDPIFEGVAGVSAPAAPTSAGFTEGLGIEPNQMLVDSEGDGKLEVILDYNPFEAGQGPLRNTLVVTEQSAAPAGSGAEQGTCCAGAIQPVGSSYLRVFDPVTGLQELDADGRPVLLRSPVPVAFMLLVIHTDGMTHGIHPGLPIFPFPGVPFVVGDHFVLGIFDLAGVAEE
jgi:hypothetical protein